MIKVEYKTFHSDIDFAIVQVLLNRIPKRGATKFYEIMPHVKNLILYIRPKSVHYS